MMDASACVHEWDSGHYRDMALAVPRAAEEGTLRMHVLPWPLARVTGEETGFAQPRRWPFRIRGPRRGDRTGVLAIIVKGLPRPPPRCGGA